MFWGCVFFWFFLFGPPECRRPGQSDYSTLRVGATGATLTGNSHEAVVAAATTLLQALERSGDRDSVTPTKFNCTTIPAWRLPALAIVDRP